MIDTPVTIGKLHAKFRGIQPELQLSQLNIANEKIKLKEIRLSINVWQFISTQNFLTSVSVTLVGAQITLIRHVDDSITLEGLKAGDGQPLWLLQGKYLLLQSSITWRDEKLNTPPRKISPVNLAIMNNGEQHRVNLLAKLSQQSEPLRVSGDFSGNPFEPKTLNGKIFLEDKNLKLDELESFGLPLSFKIIDGFANLKMWGLWQNGQLRSINGDIKLQHVALNRPQHPNLKINEFSSSFQLKHENETWFVRLPSLQLQLPTNELNGSIFATFNENNPAENGVGIFLEKLEIAPSMSLVNFFVASSFDANQLGGTFTNINLFTQPTQQKFAFDGTFNDLSANIEKTNVEHLNGYFHGNELAGTLKLNSDKLAVNAPTVFREPLLGIKLKTMLNWQQTAEAWRIESESIVLETKDIPSDSRLLLTLPKNGATFMDLQTKFEITDATQTSHYLPAKIMEKAAVDWLDNAFGKGRVKNGQVLFCGKTSDFPFEKGQGVFEVLFDAENGQLKFAPDWLPIDDVTAQVRFYQNDLQVNLSGMAQNATVKFSEVTVAKMLTSSRYVHVVGEIDGEINSVLNYMQKSPLHSRADSVLAAISPQGNTRLLLDLQIPVITKLETKVDVSVQFKQAKLKVRSLNLPVHAINGELKFTEKGVFSDPISAVALNRPIKIRLQSKEKESQTEIDIAGSTSIDDLFGQLNILPLTKLAQTAWIEGSTDYDLTLKLPYSQNPPTLKLQSMLAGITLNLPAELAKSKLQKVPFTMMLTLDDDVLLPLTFNYDERLKAAVKLDTKTKHLERGTILLGDGNVELPSSKGLSLTISRDGLALQDWLGLAAASSENSADGIHTVSIQSQNARWKKAELGVFDLVLKRENEAWRGKLNSSFAQGQIIQQNNSTLKLELEKLDLAIFKQFKTSDETKNESTVPIESSKKLPSLLLKSENTFWLNKALGKLTVETQQSVNGMTIKTIDLQAMTHNLTMTGEWQNAPISQTQLRGKLEFFKAGQLFSNLGITRDIAETTGNANLDLRWQGTPQQFDLEKLLGQVDLNLQNGRILSIEPGFGRILGVLALDQWIKRLQLDFSDIYSEGLTFNSITGHFDFSQGKASTENLIVDAIPAKILLKGDTDFVKQNVDYLASVTPKSADAVPIAGTIVSKIMSLVGKTLTGKDQDGFFFGSQYQVKGSWGNVEVIPLPENDGLIQKTWRGITDFPWLPQQFNSKETYHHD